VRDGELLRRLQRMARSRGWELEWRPDRGKGSHGLLVMNGRRTIVPDLKAELKKGTFHSVLSDLRITAEDLQRFSRIA
jgi:predicted RNA binding protein YcfA (HicA-like mRNA interferase family)